MKYKQYLYKKDVAMPRSTFYRHRAIQKKRMLEESREEQTLDDSQIDCSATFFQEHCEEDCEQSPLESTDQHQCGDMFDVDQDPTHSCLEGEISVLDQLQPAYPNCDITDEGEITEGEFEVTAEEDFWEKNKKHSLPICPCAAVTVDDVMLMCLTLGLRHNLSWACQIDILKMMNGIFKEDKIPHSKYKYLKLIDRSTDEMRQFVLCPECEKYFGDMEDLPDSIQCPCGFVVDVSSSNFFVSVDLKSQFLKLLRDPVNAEAILNYRFNRRKVNNNALEDIYDGTGYKQHFENGGILSEPLNFSLSISTDGVPMGHSRKSIWPIYVTINELPPKERNKNVLLAGLYVGEENPNQNIYLQPFVEQMNKLSTDGFHWKYNGSDVVSKVIPTCFIVDSVARFKVMNMSGIGSYYACTFCYQKAVQTTKGRRFPPCMCKPTQRTSESTRADMEKAYNLRNDPNPLKRVVKGVKGPSPLLHLFFFNLISAFVPDYMHCVLLGVIKSHMELLFDSSRKKFWKNMGDRNEIGMTHLIDAIDKRFSKICSLSAITRSVRSLHQTANWKASEWRSWLLFYCVPCLKGFLKGKYLRHLALLSSAINILLQKSVTNEDLQRAERYILEYVYLYHQYFGDTSMVLNVHLLTHIVQGVSNWGPLWTHNAFVYEDYNRHLLHLVQSPGQVIKQVTRKFLIYNDLPLLFHKFISSEKTLELCESILEKRLKHFVRCKGTILLGKRHPCNLSVVEYDCFVRYYDDVTSSSSLFSRMLYNGERYVTEEWSKNKRHNDSCIETTDSRFFTIQKILSVDDQKVILIVEEIFVDEQPFILFAEGFSFTHVMKIVGQGNLYCIEPSDIGAQCILIDFEDSKYLCKMPYGCHGD